MPPERFSVTSSPPVSLTTEPDRFSDQAWELLLASQDVARRWRHGAMDVEHLLLTLLRDRRCANWIEPLPLDVDRLLDRLEGFCADQPEGRGNTLYIGDALEDLLEAADRRRDAWGSRLIDVPHLLLALLDDRRIAAGLLAEEGLSEDLLLRQWRPGGAVPAATADLPPPAGRVVPASTAAPRPGMARPAPVPAGAGLPGRASELAGGAASGPVRDRPRAAAGPAAEPPLRLELEEEGDG